ncbi:MAG: zf-HC2 domain-containing protein [Candidatus Poribacteria bacterium]|nr:zf-HC2 domain-containing protein [Candidatus Poribacteria bacterium]
MKCEDAQNLLADYSVNGLDGEIRRKLEAHFAVCSHCAYELELLWRVVSFVESAPQKSPPPGLWEGIEASIHRNSEKMEREVGTKR